MDLRLFTVLLLMINWDLLSGYTVHYRIVQKRHLKPKVWKISSFDSHRKVQIPGNGQLVFSCKNIKCSDAELIMPHFENQRYYFVCQNDGILIGKCNQEEFFDTSLKLCTKDNKSHQKEIEEKQEWTENKTNQLRTLLEQLKTFLDSKRTTTTTSIPSASIYKKLETTTAALTLIRTDSQMKNTNEYLGTTSAHDDSRSKISTTIILPQKNVKNGTTSTTEFVTQPTTPTQTVSWKSKKNEAKFDFIPSQLMKWNILNDLNTENVSNTQIEVTTEGNNDFSKKSTEENINFTEMATQKIDFLASSRVVEGIPNNDTEKMIEVPLSNSSIEIQDFLDNITTQRINPDSVSNSSYNVNFLNENTTESILSVSVEENSTVTTTDNFVNVTDANLEKNSTINIDALPETTSENNLNGTDDVTEETIVERVMTTTEKNNVVQPVTKIEYYDEYEYYYEDDNATVLFVLKDTDLLSPNHTPQTKYTSASEVTYSTVVMSSDFQQQNATTMPTTTPTIHSIKKIDFDGENDDTSRNYYDQSKSFSEET